MAASVRSIGRPATQEVVTSFILRMIGLNTQAFSGSANPSSIYDAMVRGGTEVFKFYRETEEKDSAVGSALETRRILSIARDAKVVSADQANGQAQKFADGLKQFIESIPNFRHGRWELLDAPGYGYSVLEILWRTDGTAISTDGIIGRPQELFRFAKFDDPQTGELMLAPGIASSVELPLSKFIVSSYRPRHGDRRGLPLLRRLFWPSWFKRNTLRLMLRFLEKGNGTVVVKYSGAADEAEKEKALEAAEAIAEETFAAVPDGFQLMTEALQSTRTRDGNDYRTMFDYWDAEMTRLVLGQTLSTRGAEQQRGTMSLGEVHLQTLFEYVRNDLTDVETAINEQLAAPWLLWTYGPQALDRATRPLWKADKEPPRDVDAALDQLAKARNMGAEIPALEVYERGQIRQPDEGEKTLPPAQVPASLFTPGE